MSNKKSTISFTPYTINDIRSYYSNWIKQQLNRGWEIVFDDTSRGCLICTQLIRKDDPTEKLYFILYNSHYDKSYDSITFRMYLLNGDQRRPNENDKPFEKIFYKVNDSYRHPVYTTQYNVAQIANTLRNYRFSTRWYSNKKEINPTKSFVKMIRTHRGFSQASTKNVTISKTGNRYYVYHNKHTLIYEFPEKCA